MPWRRPSANVLIVVDFVLAADTAKPTDQTDHADKKRWERVCHKLLDPSQSNFMNPVAIPEARPRWLHTVAPALVLVTVSLLCAMLAWWYAPAGSRLLLPLLVLAPAAGIGQLDFEPRAGRNAGRVARCSEHEQAREDAVQKARRDRDLLVSALNVLPIGIAVYDRRDRPILHNRFLLELIPNLHRDDGDGPGHDDLLQLERKFGVTSDSTHTLASGTDGPMANDGQPSILLQYPGDRWIQAMALRNDQGVMVIARSDVTGLVRARHQAAVANEKL